MSFVCASSFSNICIILDSEVLIWSCTSDLTCPMACSICSGDTEDSRDGQCSWAGRVVVKCGWRLGDAECSRDVQCAWVVGSSRRVRIGDENISRCSDCGVPLYVG